MPTETAPQLLHRLLTENNLAITQSKLTTRSLEDGGLFIDEPGIVVSYTKDPIAASQVESTPITTPDPVDEQTPTETDTKTDE